MMNTNLYLVFPTTWIVVVMLLLPNAVADETSHQSATRLIDFLTYKSQDRQQTAMTFSCGTFKLEREAARSLATFGRPALASVERVLDSVEQHGSEQSSLGAGWLLSVLAKIQGQRARPRLSRMIHNPQLSFLGPSLDNAMALSLGLTSYVSSVNELDAIIDCERQNEPRLALNRLILAWERGNQPWLEASLGPRATDALNSMLRGSSWDDLRMELWGRQSKSSTSVGYRFETGNRWSEPDETLDDIHDDELTLAENPTIKTLFKNGEGANCGSYLVRFKTTESPMSRKKRPEELPYLVDNSDIRKLLRLVGSCAAH